MGITRGREGEKEKIKDVAKMQVPVAGSAGPASKLGGSSLQVMLGKPQAAVSQLSNSRREAASPAFVILHFLLDRCLQPFFPITPHAEDVQMFLSKGFRSPLEEFMPPIS